MRNTNRNALVTKLSLLLVAGLVAGCSALPDDSLAIGDQSSGAEISTVASTTTSDEDAVFDSAVVHEIELDIDDDAVTALLETYEATGEKDWASASVTIDGEHFEDVGVRLKGNSSLREADADTDPAELPWLIRLDKYVDGQNLDGYSDFVVRSNVTETSLNEAVTLDLLEMAGLASENAIAVRFSVGGGQEQLRLVVQALDETWEEENFGTVDALYKAESTGDYTYRGDDPEAYDEVFDQETGDTDDLGPLIEFLEFVNTSSDEEFAAGLSEWLDVDAFATYLAFEDLVDNFDDIDGPGNNSYLRWDSDAEQFTVVAWDHNLAFGVQQAGGGPGGVGPGAGAPPIDDNGTGTGELGGPPPPPAGQDPAREDAALDGALDGAFDGTEPAAPGAMGEMPGAGSNPLVERFLEVDDFSAKVSAATDSLTAELVTSGAAAEVLQTWVDVISDGASDLVSEATLTSEAEAVATYF